jgi:hypothetical protein
MASYPAHNLKLDQGSVPPRRRAHMDALANNPALQPAITALRSKSPLGRLNELEAFEVLAEMAKHFTVTDRNGKPVL